MTTLDPRLVARIAFRFDSHLRHELSAGDYEEVCHRNAVAAESGDLNTCASHDFCDANMVMCDAMMDCGQTPDDDACRDLWNAAWSLWKESTRRRDDVTPAPSAPMTFMDQWQADLRAAVEARDGEGMASLMSNHDRHGCYSFADCVKECGVKTRDEWIDLCIQTANESYLTDDYRNDCN